MNAIINGNVYFNKEFHKNHVILYDEKIINILNEEEYNNYAKLNNVSEINADNQLVIPGFIDVHVHGYKGVDVMDGKVESIRSLAEGITENGVTAFLPTTMTMELCYIEKALDVIREVKENSNLNPYGAMVLGAHMEGPYINTNFKGAQPEKYIIKPSSKWLENYKDIIKVTTIAPEVKGAIEVIKKYHSKINFSIGHTGASYEEAKEAIDKGATSITHLFNAMTGLHHRKPGVVGAALTCNCYSELIADKFHVNTNLYQLLINAKGIDKVLLITDCMMAGGLKEGNYELGGQEVRVFNNQCKLVDGTIAGSVLKLNKALRNFSENVVEELANLIPIVTENQAKYLKVYNEMGTLEIGKLANIVIMDENINIIKTIVKGKKVYES